MRAWAWWLLVTACGGPGLSDARLPASTSVLEIPEPDAVVVVDTAVRVDGAALIDVDAVLATDALRIAPLEAALVAAREDHAADPSLEAFRGALSLELDRDLPSDLLIRVLYTAGQAGFGKPWLVVTDPRGARRGIKLILPETASAGVAAATAAGEVVAGGYANPRIELVDARGVVVRVSDRAVDPGTGLLLACASVPCGQGWPFVELGRLARRIKLDHPRDRGVLMVPGRAVPIQALVGALDATRHDAGAGRPGTEVLPDVVLGRATE